MAKIKKINGKIGNRIIKNKYLNIDGSLDLIEKFPVYKNKKKRKKRVEIDKVNLTHI